MIANRWVGSASLLAMVALGAISIPRSKPHEGPSANTVVVAPPQARASVAVPVTSPPQVVATPIVAAPIVSTHDRLWAAGPSVSKDGSTIVVPYSGEGGASGQPTLALRVFDRRGRLVKELPVQSLDQCGDGVVDCPASTRAHVASQERAAAAFLDALVEMPPLELANGYEDATMRIEDATNLTFSTETLGLEVALSATGKLTVRPRGHAPVTRSSRRWRTEPSEREAAELERSFERSGVDCFHPARLRRVAADFERRVAVVTIGFRGNDSCWEPDDEMAVVSW